MTRRLGRYDICAVAIIVLVLALGGCATTPSATDEVPGSASRCACELVPLGVVPDDARYIAARARGLV